LLTDDIGITKINSAHLAKHESTDVISFCFEPMPGGEKTSCAEVVVNVERAIEEGNKRKAWSASKELSLYLAHGCDHLSGAVDSTPTERSRMRRRELRWLKDAPAIDKENKHSTIEHLFAE
jgi:rRNA maturation RNase YbeY